MKKKNSAIRTDAFLKTMLFWRRFGFPFTIIILIGVVIYLGSVIARYNDEQKHIESLLKTSNPAGQFALHVPKARDIKKWSTFVFPGGDFSFRYPINWRTEHSGTAVLIREGEAAVVSVNSSEEYTGESMLLTYRVARISALLDEHYVIDAIFEAEVSGESAFVIYYRNPETKASFYETAFAKDQNLYRIILVIAHSGVDPESVIVDEYKAMLGTIEVK